MVQVLPYVPSFGEKLAETLAQAGSNVAQGLVKRQAQQQLRSLFQPTQVPSTVSSQQGSSPYENAMAQQPQQSQQQPAYGPSPIENIMNKPGGPNLSDVSNVYKIAERANPGFGKTAADYLLQQKNELFKHELQQKTLESQRRSDILKKEEESRVGRREGIRKSLDDVNLGLNAVASGDVGGFDINWFANLLGPIGEPLKNLKGVQLESAMKNLLVDTIKGLGGRQNQWIEQLTKSAMAGIGKKKEANQLLLNIEKTKLGLESRLLDIQDELSAYYEAKGERPPSNIDQIAHTILKPEAENKWDKTYYHLREIYEKSKGPRFLKSLEKVPNGTPLTLEKRDALIKMYKGDAEKAKQKAEELGYTIPDPNVVFAQEK